MRVALTYDDGPSEWTGQILDALDAAGAVGTFFVLGRSIYGREDLLERMALGGHEIGCHGYSHTPMTKLTDGQLAEEVLLTSNLIRYACGRGPTCWRPPHHAAGPEQERVVATVLDGPRVGTNNDPGDWYEADGLAIAGRALAELRDGSIINLHDGFPPSPGPRCTTDRGPTVGATTVLLAALDAMGAQVVAATELLS